jgi:hypothetical protein
MPNRNRECRVRDHGHIWYQLAVGASVDLERAWLACGQITGGDRLDV